MHRAWRLLPVILLAATVLAPASIAAPEPSLLERSTSYRSSLEGLRVLQNSDGGFGRALFADDNSTSTTEPTRASFLETVLVIHLLQWEDVDRLETWRNWERVEVSLAASNTTTALAWLQRHEAKHGAEMGVGDRAFLAMAYSDLGDTANAERLLLAIINGHAASGNGMPASDAARVLIASSVARVQLNATHNATLAGLKGGLAGMDLSTSPEALAWSLLADPDQAARRGQLGNILQEGDLPGTLRSLAAWALAASGGPDALAEPALIAAYGSAPVGLARAYYLLGERTAHPEFSPHAPVLEGASAIGARSSANGREVLQQPPASEPAAGEPAAEGTSGFPVPPVLVMITVLLGTIAIVVVKLSYGLKREELTGTRREIYAYIEKHPGEHFSKIRRDLGLAPGTFQHHLSVLESEGWITSFKEPRYKRYFVSGNRYKQIIAGYQYRQKFAALANDTTRDLVRIVHQRPGVTQKELAQQLNLHASTVNWHAKRLQQAGILNPERSGREVRYHVDEDMVEKMMTAS